eukprot:748525-Prorocentrum_minimum.AAC.1
MDSEADTAPAVGEWQRDRIHRAVAQRRLAFNERAQVTNRLPYLIRAIDPRDPHPFWPHIALDTRRHERPTPAQKATNCVGGLRERRDGPDTEGRPVDIPSPRGRQQVEASPRGIVERAHAGCQPVGTPRDRHTNTPIISNILLSLTSAVYLRPRTQPTGTAEGGRREAARRKRRTSWGERLRAGRRSTGR